jgi:tetratricopeptide (TPR) repeat protein
MNTKTELFKQINKAVFKSGISLLIVAGIFISASPAKNFALTLNKPVSTKEIKGQDDAFEKKFREGRDLIDKEEWAKSAEKFNEVVSKYPANKSTDAALYWLAFCYKKQKQFKETEITLNRLLKEFPASSWADDARVMKMEILQGQPARLIDQIAALPPVPAVPAVPVLPNVPNLPDIVNKPIPGEPPTAGVLPIPIDRETEIKIAAFKNLLSADPKTAIQTLGDTLNPDSNADEIFKQAMLRVLRKPFLLDTQAHANISASGAGNQLLTFFRETLIKSFQKESSIKIRREIIYVLAGLTDDESINYLSRLYASDSNREIKKTIINSFGSVSNFVSTNLLGSSNDSYASRKIKFDKLVEIIRFEKDIELRRAALSISQLIGGWATASEKVVDTFAQIYDAETDEQFKMSVILSLAGSKQNQALRKLLEIAKNDKSDKLKLEAIYALRTSKNPDVLKFLEELFK